MDSYERGLEALTRMLGRDRAEAVAARFRSLSPAFEQEAVSVVFGRTWARGGHRPQNTLTVQHLHPRITWQGGGA